LAALKSWVGIGIVTALLLAALGGYTASVVRALPDPGQESSFAQSILIYDRNGTVIAERNARGESRINLKLPDMGKLGPEATLAAEDRDFYRHGPVDVGAIVRAGTTDAAHRKPLQGGSTITQQLVKMELLHPDRTLPRKGQEAYLAWALERRYSKDQILEMYLNRVYYGHNAYGLGAATKTYFGRDKQPKDLTAAQAAFLAGLLQAPSANDPRTNFDGARSRQLYVLKGMVAVGAISQAEADKAAGEDIKAALRYDSTYRQTPAPHFVDYVMQRLEADYGPDAVQRGGLAVHTTLDLKLQALAEQAVREGVRDLGSKGVNNGAMLLARPNTGEILAWVGSADYANPGIGGQFNVVVSPRQPGSSFKPYVYEAALKDRKITLCTVLHDRPSNFNGYRPLDWDNRYMGDMTARKALLLSRNIPAVETASIEGIDKVIGLASAIGVRSKLDPSLPTAIGSSEVTLFEHVQGYQVFANQGQKVPLMSITRVDQGGSRIYDQTPGKQPGQSRAMTPAEAFLVTDILKGYQSQWYLSWNRQMASKSGTTGVRMGAYPDSWMMAYNPDIVVGAWVGNTGANGEGTTMNAFGVDVGAAISARLINALPQELSRWYARPDGIVQGKGGEIFLSGTENQCPGGGGRQVETPPKKGGDGGGDEGD
jgi:membrane peptidoglycan carboxypeptidase